MGNSWRVSAAMRGMGAVSLRKPGWWVLAVVVAVHGTGDMTVAEVDGDGNGGEGGHRWSGI